jgi:hypothetical protein
MGGGGRVRVGFGVRDMSQAPGTDKITLLF